MAAGAARLRDAAVAAFVAAMLALPLVGLRAIDEAQGLRIETRFDWVAIAVVCVFLGRLVFSWSVPFFLSFRTKREASPTPTLPRVAGEGEGGGRAWYGSRLAISRWREITPFLVWVGIGFAVVLPFLPFASRYVVDLATTVLIYVMLGWGLNIVVGLAGLLDLGYVAFYAVGAYSYALLAINFQLSFWECLPLAGLFAAFFGVLLGFPVLRLRGDYLAIVTLGFGEIVRIILINWQSVTGGPNGVSGIPRPSFFGAPFSAHPADGVTAFHQLLGIEYAANHRIVFLYFVILALALLTNLFTLRIRRLPVGRAWEALREDEIACRALGINARNTKLTAFGIGAMFGGFAGAFFATRQGFISPESFAFMESATILAIVVLGGMGSQLGVVIAALFLILLPELGRDFAQFRMLLFGLAMVLIMVWRPRGLLGHREPTLKWGGSP